MSIFQHFWRPQESTELATVRSGVNALSPEVRGRFITKYLSRSKVKSILAGASNTEAKSLVERLHSGYSSRPASSCIWFETLSIWHQSARALLRFFRKQLERRSWCESRLFPRISNQRALYSYSTPISPITAEQVLGSWETLYSWTFRGVVLDALGVILASPGTERALESGPLGISFVWRLA